MFREYIDRCESLLTRYSASLVRF